MVDRPRIKVSYGLAAEGGSSEGFARDLSLGGVFVETAAKAPAEGALIALVIEHNATKVEVEGRVLTIGKEGFALRFIDLPNDAAASLHSILAATVPRKGTTLGLGEPEEGVAKYESAAQLRASEPKPEVDVETASTPASAKKPSSARMPVAPKAERSSVREMLAAGPPPGPPPPPVEILSRPIEPLPTSTEPPSRLWLFVALAIAVLLIGTGFAVLQRL